MKQKRFENILTFGLIGAAMFNPWSAGFALLILVSGQAAERYFTRNISDPDREQIQALTSKVKEHSEIFQKQGLAQAFGGKR